MRLFVFSVFDAAAQAYLQPFFFPMPGQAIRAFVDAVNGGNEQFSRHAADFTLFQVGEFVQDTGELLAQAPKSLGNALQFKEAAQ